MLKIYTHAPGRPEAQLDGLVQFSRLAGLLAGLDALNIPYEYQPAGLPEEGDRVLVISDHEWLREIIQHKRQGTDFTLIAGPIFELEDTHRTGLPSLMTAVQAAPDPVSLLSMLDTVFADSEVDGVLTAGAWAKGGWRFCAPELAQKLFEWRAGVDTDYWDGVSDPVKGRVLVYEKRKPGLGNQVKKALIQSGYDVDMIHYGRYQKDEFREKLRSCEFAVVLSQRETQGIALAEMWAMNVPTLCWESFVTEFNGILIPSSSCPYLTRRTGWRWRNIPELEQVLSFYHRDSFSPRTWVAQNMSHKVSATLLLELFDYLDFRRSKRISSPT